MNKSQPLLYSTYGYLIVKNKKGEKMMVDLTSLLWISAGAATLALAFFDYTVTYKKGMKKELNLDE